MICSTAELFEKIGKGAAFENATQGNEGCHHVLPINNVFLFKQGTGAGCHSLKGNEEFQRGYSTGGTSSVREFFFKYL